MRRTSAVTIICLVLLSVLSIYVMQLRVQETSPFLNGGFEDDLNDWVSGTSGSPAWGVTTENCHSGDKSFKISSTFSDAVYLRQLLSFSSSNYRFSAWIYRTSSNSSTVIELLKKDPWLAGRGWAPVCSAFYIMDDRIGVMAWDDSGSAAWESQKITWLNISLAPNQWHELSVVSDGDSKKQSVYLDSTLIAELVTSDSWAPELLILGDVSGDRFLGTFYFDDIQLSENMHRGSYP